jgi:hypothetical protein
MSDLLRLLLISSVPNKSELKKSDYLSAIGKILPLNIHHVFKIYTRELFLAKFFNILASNQEKQVATNQLFKILCYIALLAFIKWLVWRTAALISNTFFPRIREVDLYMTCFEYIHQHSFGYFNNNFLLRT